MSRRDNADVRCRGCRMHGSLCVCPLVPRLTTRTRLVLIIHRVEARKPSNTGQLAAACLPNSEVLVRGHVDAPSGAFAPDAGSQPLFLFPHEDAVPLRSLRSLRDAAFSGAGPTTLIVPDGTWRQASKVRQRVAGLRDIPCVSLPPEEPSIYRLRAEAHAHGLATIEAIARAFGILEGPHVRRALERVFRAMVERTLWSRGELGTHEVTGGIPEGALRHDPRSGLAPRDSAETRAIAPGITPVEIASFDPWRRS